MSCTLARFHSSKIILNLLIFAFYFFGQRLLAERKTNFFSKSSFFSCFTALGYQLFAVFQQWLPTVKAGLVFDLYSSSAQNRIAV